MDDEKWIKERQIKFSLASEEDIPELIKFLQENFLPEEPIARNLKTMEGSGMIDRQLRNEMCNGLIKNPLSKVEIAPASIIARSTIDNSISGCRIGQIVSKQKAKNDYTSPVGWLGSLPLFFSVPKKLVGITNTEQLMKDLKYAKVTAFEELKDAKRIYFASNVCVSGKARGLGLGSELIKRGYDIAKKNGCGYTYIWATSIYSQNIFHKLGNCEILHEVKYEDYLYDRKGSPFMIEPREHKVSQILAIHHGNE